VDAVSAAEPLASVPPHAAIRMATAIIISAAPDLMGLTSTLLLHGMARPGVRDARKVRRSFERS